MRKQAVTLDGGNTISDDVTRQETLEEEEEPEAREAGDWKT